MYVPGNIPLRILYLYYPGTSIRLCSLATNIMNCFPLPPKFIRYHVTSGLKAIEKDDLVLSAKSILPSLGLTLLPILPQQQKAYYPAMPGIIFIYKHNGLFLNFACI